MQKNSHYLARIRFERIAIYAKGPNNSATATAADNIPAAASSPARITISQAKQIKPSSYITSFPINKKFERIIFYFKLARGVNGVEIEAISYPITIISFDSIIHGARSPSPTKLRLEKLTKYAKLTCRANGVILEDPDSLTPILSLKLYVSPLYHPTARERGLNNSHL
ncbi:hypothetical protein CONCODRAFT_5953 [Conidiobolus coronatus NRRL 28638]|uniref:Uncharacterized protein n=1 Tax=Conidiobolus coronatus (strain ATCC 28846 / CBS 209.66 / NRRL 28638) TaxID=796925 RepID=A0A137P8I6_CONC2|nr:hypothetical protein CONCODRAFT_5953 [Conidiobolus coronatus NRRL 28638]|eukprot:KXN71318.1 hypothetical protein CONCODRAFT_5953 [Conidiobolus coronatus NRRL 28638]